MANRYWIGGSGNWTDTAHWSTTSGGTGGASVPAFTDDVIFDSGSGLSGAMIQLTGVYDSAGCRNFTSTTGATYSFNYSTSDFSIYGDAAMEAGTTFTNDTWLYYDGTTTASWNLSGADIFYVYIRGTGELTLASNLTVRNDFAQYDGTVNANGHTITSGDDLFWEHGTFNLGNGTLNANYVQSYPNTGKVVNLSLDSGVVNTPDFEINNVGEGGTTNFDAGTSTINIIRWSETSAGYFDGGDRTYYTVRVKAPASTDYTQFLGSNNIDTLIIDEGITVEFANASEQTVNNFTAIGTQSSPITLYPASSGSFTLSKSSGIVVCEYLDLTKSTATGGASWKAGFYSTDNGDNSGWLFDKYIEPAASSFSLTGVNSSFLRTLAILAQVSSFSYMGVDAILSLLKITADTVSYIISAFSAELQYRFIQNMAKPSTTFINLTKVSIGETWETITTTWATESRTWLRISQLFTNNTKQSSPVTNVNKP